MRPNQENTLLDIVSVFERYTSCVSGAETCWVQGLGSLSVKKFGTAITLLATCFVVEFRKRSAYNADERLL